MSNFDISGTVLELDCPCGTKVSFTIGQVAREETIKCSSCGTNIGLVDNNGSNKRAIRDTKRAVDGLEQSIKRLNRRLKL